MQKNMKTIQSDKEIRLEAFRQHWNQMRHTENLRSGFTHFYAIIVAGILAYVMYGPPSEHWPIYIVGAALSLLGLLYSQRAKRSISIHREKARSIAESSGIQNDEIENLLPFTPEKSRCARYTSIRTIFVVFYSLWVAGFIALLVLEKLAIWSI